MVALTNRPQPNQARSLRLDAVIEMTPFSCLVVSSVFRGAVKRPVLYNKNQYACRFLAWQSGDPALTHATGLVASIFRIMEYFVFLAHRRQAGTQLLTPFMP